MYLCCQETFSFCGQCCNCISQSCQECCQCLGNSCQCLNQACGSILECLSNSCKIVFSFFQQCFKPQFSFVTFLAFFLNIVPFGFMIYASSTATQNQISCVQPIINHSIIQGLMNVFNFLFLVYLLCRYGKKQQMLENTQWKYLNTIQRVSFLFLFDYIVCIYVFCLIAQISVTGMNIKMFNQEPFSSSCYTQLGGLVMNASHYNILATEIFIYGGAVIFSLLLAYHACEDGSFSCSEICNCCCGILTCGCFYKQPQIDKQHYQLANNNSNINNNNYNNNNNQNQQNINYNYPVGYEMEVPNQPNQQPPNQRVVHQDPYIYRNPNQAQRNHEPPNLNYGFQDPNAGSMAPPPKEKRFFGLF